jgi:hypothetical protein
MLYQICFSNVLLQPCGSLQEYFVDGAIVWVEISKWFVILGLDKNVCEMMILKYVSVLLQLRYKVFINMISNVAGTMDAKKPFLLLLLSIVAFLTAVDAGKYTLMNICFDKYRYNIPKFKSN